MKRRHFCYLLLLTLLMILPEAAFPADEALHSVWAVKDCKVIIQPGRVIEKGMIIIRDGLIEYAGADAAMPADAEIIDGAGLTAYAGFIDALGDSILKMPEEKTDPSKMYSGDFSEKERGIAPEIRAYDYVNLTKAGISKYHKNGITSALVMPSKGIFTGQSSLFSLSQTDKEKAVIFKDNLLGIGFSASSLSGYPDSLMGVVAFLRQKFTDLAYYIMHTGRWENTMNGIARPEYNAQLEELLPFFTGKKQVVFLCRNKNDIIRAIKIGSEYKLKYLICDIGGEAFRVIPELKKSGAAVLVTLGFKSPSTSVYSRQGKHVRSEAERELYPSNAAKLAEAGIKFAFSSYSTPEPEKFLENVMKAMNKGLSSEKALRALTVDAASIFGADRALGTIESGKIANLVISQGDPLIKDSKVKYVFSDGIKFDIKEKKAEEGEKPTVNVTGKWEITTEGAMAMKYTLELTQEEATLSGKRITQFGQDEFTDGTVSGNQISFTISVSAMGRMVDIYVSGVVEGDTISGTISYGAMGSAEFTGKRIP
jgi:imidazolonepropionase-like amidohydrolase